MFRIRQIITVFSLAIVIGVWSVSFAFAGDERERRGHVSVFGSVWANGNLIEIPYNAVTGGLDLEDAYFVGIAGSLVLFDDFDVPIPLALFEGMDIEFEVQVVQHFDLQDHTEGTFAFMLRSGQVNVTEKFSFNVAAGEGFSYAFSEPDLEWGSNGRRGQDVTQFLNYLVFEIELAHAEMEQLHLVGRVHHRSGVFGLMGGTTLGSNYLGVGLRYDIE